MRQVQVYNVAPCVPEKIAFLEELSRNLWWCWNHHAIELYRRIDPKLWRECGRNPIELMRQLPQANLQALSNDDAFLGHVERVKALYQAHQGRGKLTAPGPCIGYFSLEYGLTNLLRIYSGGLGVLAGDHLKAASDLGLPLAAVGLFYNQGYFEQFLNDDGLQQEAYAENEIRNLPMRLARDSSDQPVRVSLPLPEGELHARVWRINVGVVPFLLLDADVPENPEHFRKVTARLYGDGKHNRLRQELLLGVGGYQALVACGFTPEVCHLNEGHAAFLSLARLAHLRSALGVDLETAIEIVERSNVFTTHTPVPAGNETFPLDLLRPHLEALSSRLNLSPEIVLRLGGADAPGAGELSMTVLGMRMSHHRNGVSKLHGEVARHMWKHLWPNRLESEIPIGHITNGVHVSTWIGREVAALFDRYLGPNWERDTGTPEVIARIDDIPNEELSHAHEMARARLVRLSRERLERQGLSRNAGMETIRRARSALNSDFMTIGFARRFATYKRGNLLLRHPERLIALLTNKDRPVQMIFAGKAHPEDHPGKDIIREIVHFSRQSGVDRHIVFLENYDMRVARFLVQGSDIWLNTPRRPHEASGTSGMKAALNGVLHVSILDGWWAEAYDDDDGFAIGAGQHHGDLHYQDEVEAHALYNLLETQVIPTYHQHRSSHESSRWVEMMKSSMKMALANFSADRMVRQYQQRFYQPAAANFRELTAKDAMLAKTLLEQRRRLDTLWRDVRLEMLPPERDLNTLHVGDRFTVSANVFLGQLSPEEARVEICFGQVGRDGELVDPQHEVMTAGAPLADGSREYRKEIRCTCSGRFGYVARATPAGEPWRLCMPGYVTWAT